MQHASAVPDDLFEKFKDNNKPDITLLENEDNLEAVLHNWMDKPGYPVITVVKSGKNIKLTQSRFLFSTDATAQAVKYDVYLTWKTDTDTGSAPTQPSRPQAWLRSSDQDKEIELGDNWSWVIL
ncbi:Aminopeptidase, partial [Gryllus bimaculatus]